MNQAVLTVTADNKVCLMAAAAAVQASYSGFVNGDGVGVLSGSPSLTTTADNNSAPGMYPIAATQGTLQAANYSFQFVSGVLTVNPGVLTVTANNLTITYGQNTPPLTYTEHGLCGTDNQGTDTANLAYLRRQYRRRHMGTYPFTVLQWSTLSNFTFVFVNGN